MITKSVSTQQAEQQLDATHDLAVSPNGSCNIAALEGYMNAGVAATFYYLQLVGVPMASVVAGTTIPLYSVAITGVNGFSFVYPEGLNTAALNYPSSATVGGDNTLPIYAVISSTNATCTPFAGNVDLRVDIEMSVVEVPNQTIVGDLTTNVNALTVYADPNPAKRLIGFKVINLDGVNNWIMLFAYPNPAVGAKPIAVWPVPDIAEPSVFNFGSGLAVEQGLPSTYIQAYGCYLLISDSPTGLIASAQAYNIQATYI